MKIKLTILTILLLNFITSFAQNYFSKKQLKSIDSISLQDVVKNGPGIATGIVKNGKIIYEKYAGYADLKDSLLITNQSRFNIASNAKQFTALAVLTLAAEKRIKLSDDIRIYLPMLYKGLEQKITIENLLNHSSGIRDVYDLWALQGITWWKQTYSNEDALLLLSKQTDLNFEPGKQYLYSNSNYILLAQIVSKVSGLTFTAYTNQLFKKLDMPNTSFVDDYKMIKGPIAYPYFNFDKWTGYNWISNIQGDGNLFSTLADQLQYEKIIQLRASQYLPTSLIDISQLPISNSSIQSYGYGLEFAKYKNFDYSFHEGSTGAWKATTLRFPKEQLAIVTLTNSGKAISAMQTRQVADVLLNINTKKQNYLTKPERSRQLVKLEDITGTYQNEEDFTFRFEIRDSSLYLIRSGRNDIRLVRESNNIFHQWNDDAFKQEFILNSENQMEVTAYYTTHSPYTLKRENVNWKDYNFTKLQGKFFNGETGVDISIKWLKDKEYEIKIRDEINKALLITPKKLITDNYTIELVNAKDGNINQLQLNGSRIKNIKFNRVKK